MSDFSLFLDAPGSELEWNVPARFPGYAMFIKAELLDPFAKVYSFVGYSDHEALNLTDDEQEVLSGLFEKALAEYRKEDGSQDVLLSYASIILSYANLYYQRQFESRSSAYHRVVSDFYAQLKAFFDKEGGAKELPSVKHFAAKAHLSPNYFGDLIKHFTGSSPLDHIHEHIIRLAKEKLKQSNHSVSEIAYSLGFAYPSYFTKFFRQKTGIAPGRFKKDSDG